MKKTLVTLFAVFSLLCNLETSAQSLVFHLIDGTTAEVELSSSFRMSTVGNKTIVSLADGSTKEFIQSDILTVTYNEILGDVNRDKTVDVADIATVISIMAGQEPAKQISVTTGDATYITQDLAYVEGTVNNVESPVNVGILYGTSSELSIEHDTKVTITANGNFRLWLLDLIAGTTYYYCAYAEVDGKYYYGDIKSFTTENPPAPIIVTTDEATNIEETRATIWVHFVFNIDITKSYTAGLFISTSETPSSSNSKDDYSYESNDKITARGVWRTIRLGRDTDEKRIHMGYLQVWLL